MRQPPAYSPGSFYLLAIIGTIAPVVALIVYAVAAELQSAFLLMDRSVAEMLGDLLAFGLFAIIAAIHLFLLYRMWRQIDTPGAQGNRAPLITTLLLLVPVWNLYWSFVAYAGLASALNHHVRTRSLIAPRNPAALASVGCALACVVAAAGLIAYGIDSSSLLRNSAAEQIILPLCFIIALFCSFPTLILFLISWWAMVIQSAAIARNIRHPSADQPPANAPPTAPGRIVAPLPRD